MKNWTREEEIVVFDLYCKIPFNKSSKNHPDVIRVANLIGRSPSSVNMKIGNFGSFDENLKQKGIVGLTNASKLDGEIWNEFNEHWDELSAESAQIIARMLTKTAPFINNIDIPLGKEKETIIKQRVNQSFFRSAVLASYNCKCCITGLPFSDMLIASHIKPWKDSTDSEKTNPRNGLCLNALHDKAFDKGYITVKPNGQILISKDLKKNNSDIIKDYFLCYDGKMIHLPEKFLPDKVFLEYHNDVIFEKRESNENKQTTIFV